MLRELAAALDAMPEKALVAMALFDGDGNVCSLGAPGQASGTKDSMRQLDPEAYGSVAGAFGVAPAMIREIAYENDESVWESETPEHRWRRIRAWVTDNLKGPT